MPIQVNQHRDKNELGKAAAAQCAAFIREAIRERGLANVIIATGASQFEVLAALLEEKDIPWQRVHFFHLDEYVGMDVNHPASFRKYLWERFLSKLPVPPASMCMLNGEIDAGAETLRASALIEAHPIDVAFVGIGENAHLAFNDPPADFETEKPYLVVDLDEKCRLQQVGEGWFASLEEVPAQAMSMSIRQVMKSRHLIVSAPDERKAEAVASSVNGPVTPEVPASIMQQHESAHLYLDPGSASKL